MSKWKSSQQLRDEETADNVIFWARIVLGAAALVYLLWKVSCANVYGADVVNVSDLRGACHYQAKREAQP